MLHLWIFVCITLVDFTDAPVAELVDAADLKSVDRKVVPVQVRPGAPITKPPFSAVFYYRLAILNSIIKKTGRFNNGRFSFFELPFSIHGANPDKQEWLPRLPACPYSGYRR